MPNITPIRPTVIGLVNTEVTIGITISNAYPVVVATQITWYHESDLATPLTSSPGGQYTFSNEMRSLTINQLTYADEGNYTVVISHVTGSQSVIINIDVQGEPEQIYCLTSRNLGLNLCVHVYVHVTTPSLCSWCNDCRWSS